MIKQEHDYRYAVIDDDGKVTGFLGKATSEKLKFVDANEYKLGDKYPHHNIEDYRVAEVKFVRPINNKAYNFRCYDTSIDIGDHVLVDTVYGEQLGYVVGVHERDFEEGGVVPTKDIISYIPDWDDFVDRCEQRRTKQQMKQAEEEVEATAKKLVDATNVAIKIGCNIDGLKASINRIFGVKDE